PGNAPVLDFHYVLLAALAAELEFDPGAPHGCVAILHRGQAVGLVVARVFVVAHANETDFEQSNDRGQDLFTAKTFTSEVASQLTPDAGQRAGKVDQSVIFGLIARLPPARVVEVLLAPAFVTTGRLKMAVIKGTNPNVHPCRRDHQRVDSLERVPVANDPAFRRAVAKPAPASLAANARPFISDITQADDLS